MGGQHDRVWAGAAGAEAGRSGCETHSERIADDDSEGNVRDARAARERARRATRACVGWEGYVERSRHPGGLGRRCIGEPG